jgi:hypothetical protein
MTGLILSRMFETYTGEPELLTATYDDGYGIYDVKGTGNTVKDFYLRNNVEGIFKFTWKGGVFSLYLNDV